LRSDETGDQLMKRLLTTLVILTGLFGAGGCEQRAASVTALKRELPESFKALQKDNYATALKELRPSAEQGNATAQFWLGTMYGLGKGVTQDYAEGMKWFRKSAEQGNADAQRFLGKGYANGEGVTQDYPEAAKWLRKAAEQGNVMAQFELGTL
jgi:TPR repeat protein